MNDVTFEGLGLPEEKKEQVFDWGTMDWIWEPPSPTAEQVSVCILSIRPQRRQWRHLQTGIKQFIHVLEGQGVHYINDRQETLEKGKSYTVPPAVEHEIVNVGRGPLRLLIVYSPYLYLELNQDREKMATFFEGLQAERRDDSLFSLQQFLNKLKDATGLRASFVDQQGRLLIATHTEPYCASVGASAQGASYCARQIHEALAVSDRIKAPIIRYCCAGLVIIAQSFWLKGFGMAGIVCGPVFLTRPAAEAVELNRGKIGSLIPFDRELTRQFKSLPIIAKSRLYVAREFLSIMSAFEKRVVAEGRTAERALLERQIKPHFMFNALNVLAAIAQAEGAAQTGDLIAALAGLLRYQLRGEEYQRTLEEELKCVDFYIRIQQLRLGSRLQVNRDIDQQARGCKIPAMLIQNLVENAIQHGIMHKREGGQVSIAVRRAADGLSISVEDDGVGVEPERLALIEKMLATGAKPRELEGTGLWNIYYRLESAFAGRSSLSFKSDDSGTRVAISLKT